MAQRTESEGHTLVMIRMNPQLKEKLADLASTEGRPVSSFARHILERFVEATEETQIEPAPVPVKMPEAYLNLKASPMPTDEELQRRNEEAMKHPDNNPSPEFLKALEEKHQRFMEEAQRRWDAAEKKREAAFKAMMRKFSAKRRPRIPVKKTRAPGSRIRASRSSASRAPASSDDGPADPALETVTPKDPPMPALAGFFHSRRGVR